MKNKFILFLVAVTISLMLTACSEQIVPTDSTDVSTEVSDEVTEQATTPETHIEITTKVQEEVPVKLVEPGERDYEYEKDIVFIGDSICKGLRAYSGFLDETHVFAEGNVASWSFFDYKFTVNGGEYSGVELMKRCQPKAIYMWFGMNDARYTNKDTYIENLKKIADAFLEVSPHSKIVIMSITPICSFHKWYDDYANGVTNDDPNVRINYLNESAQKYFEGLNDDTYSFLNVHDLLMDDKGYLIEDYHSGDGLHINPKAYNVVLGAVAQNKVKANPEYVHVTPSFPYVQPQPEETTVAKETTAQKTTVPPETTTEEITVAPETTTPETTTAQTQETTSESSERPIAVTVAN